MKIQTIEEMLREIPYIALDIILNNDIYTLDKTICIVNRAGNRCLLTDWKINGDDDSLSYTRNCLMGKNDVKGIVVGEFKNFISNNGEEINSIVERSKIKGSVNMGVARSAIINAIITKINEDYWRESTLATSLSRVFSRSFSGEKELQVIPSYKDFLSNNPTAIEKELFKMVIREDASLFSAWHLYVDRTDMSVELKYVLWTLVVIKTWREEFYIEQFNVRSAGKLTIFKNKIVELMEAANEV